jgi:hypothetical protein
MTVEIGDHHHDAQSLGDHLDHGFGRLSDDGCGWLGHRRLGHLHELADRIGRESPLPTDLHGRQTTVTRHAVDGRAVDIEDALQFARRE